LANRDIKNEYKSDKVALKIQLTEYSLNQEVTHQISSGNPISTPKPIDLEASDRSVKFNQFLRFFDCHVKDLIEMAVKAYIKSYFKSTTSLKKLSTQVANWSS